MVYETIAVLGFDTLTEDSKSADDNASNHAAWNRLLGEYDDLVFLGDLPNVEEWNAHKADCW